jgi:glycerol-3-phosphate acyltransferase PlsY
MLGCAAVVGHVYSVFVRFRGGKGVATAAGVVLGVVPWATGVAVLTWVAIVWATGFVSVGSIAAAAVLPVAAYWLDPSARFAEPALALLALFVIVMHRANIRRLLQGTEHRFGKRNPSA